MNRLQPFFTYFGGKWRIASHYPAPNREALIEPFAGSAGYALRHPHKDVLLVDVDPRICGVWEYLIHVSEAEILSLPTRVVDVRELSVCQEAAWLIGFWLNKGTTSPSNTPGKWMRDDLRNGHRVNSYWGHAIKRRIAGQLCWIRHWHVQNISYEKIDNRDACWFVDPPYQGVNLYKYCTIDYHHLAEWCKSRNGSVIVCEQSGSTWLPFKSFRQAKTLEGKKGGHKIRETIWTQGIISPVASSHPGSSAGSESELDGGCPA